MKAITETHDAGFDAKAPLGMRHRWAKLALILLAAILFLLATGFMACRDVDRWPERPVDPRIGSTTERSAAPVATLDEAGSQGTADANEDRDP